MSILGPNWSFIATDVTDGASGTFQMSDHLPMWVELKVDFSDRYLEGLQKAEVDN